MTQGSEQAPAGWYSDPHSPERMRYFDGEMWTNHFHHPGRLPDVGNWLSTTFAVFGRYWQGAALLTIGTSLIGGLGIWVALRLLVSDVAVVDERLVNAGAGTIVGAIVIGLFALVWQGFGWLAMSRFMQRAHFQASPSVAESLQHGLRRLPRYLAVMFSLALAAFLLLMIVALLTVAVPALGVLAILALVIGGVWVMVKLAFLFVAIAVTPRGTSVLQASASVSSGRFWAVLGRLALLTIGLAIAGQIIAVGLGEYGQFVDSDEFSNVVQVRNDTVIIRDFKIADVLPSTGKLVVVLVINSIVQGASAIISTSALMRLYLDSGAPSEL